MTFAQSTYIPVNCGTVTEVSGKRNTWLQLLMEQGCILLPKKCMKKEYLNK